MQPTDKEQAEAREVLDLMMAAPYGDCTIGHVVCAETTRGRLEAAWLPLIAAALRTARQNRTCSDEYRCVNCYSDQGECLCPATPASASEAVPDGPTWADYWLGRGMREVAHNFEEFSRAEEWAMQRTAPASGEGQQGESLDEMLSASEPVISERVLAELLPHTYYLDPPDGGNVSILEQLHRQAKDAERYRLLRRKVCIVGASFHIVNARPTYVAPDPAAELDASLDALLGSEAIQQQAGQAVAWADPGHLALLKKYGGMLVATSECEPESRRTTALYTTPQTHDGYVLVPREPTEGMLLAGALSFRGSFTPRVWRAMIAASEASGG